MEFRMGERIKIDEKEYIITYCAEWYIAMRDFKTGDSYMIPKETLIRRLRAEELKQKEAIKTNKFKHGEKVIEWDLKGNNLCVKVEDWHIQVKTLLRLLIQEVPQLQNYKYRRVSPYKVKHDYARNREDRNHVWLIDFIDVKDNNEIKTNEIIRANTSGAVEIGEYNLFVPDLLEVAIDKNLVYLEGDVYKAKDKTLERVLEVEYIDNRWSKEHLEQQGWTVPMGYVEKC